MESEMAPAMSIFDWEEHRRELSGGSTPPVNLTRAALTVQGGNTEYIVWELAIVSTACNLFSLVVVFLLQRQFGRAIVFAKTASQKRKKMLYLSTGIFVACFTGNAVIQLFVPFYTGVFEWADFGCDLFVCAALIAHFA